MWTPPSANTFISQRYVSVFAHLLPSATMLRRLCFYTCLSFCPEGGGVYLSVCWDTTPPQSRPPGSRPPGAAPAGSRQPPWKQTPPGSRHPPGADTPPGSRHPLGSRHPWEQTVPREQTPPPPDQAHPPQADGYCCGRYASYWNAFLFVGSKYLIVRLLCLFCHSASVRTRFDKQESYLLCPYTTFPLKDFQQLFFVAVILKFNGTDDIRRSREVFH